MESHPTYSGSAFFNRSMLALGKLVGKTTSKVTNMSARTKFCFGNGSPSPFMRWCVPGLTILLRGILTTLSSRVGTGIDLPKACPTNASFREILAVYWILLSVSLEKNWCGLSLIVNIISAGMVLGFWSPSFGKVILVPAFQPFFTVMLKIFSSVQELSPSELNTFFLILKFFVVPSRSSSMETNISFSMGGSWFGLNEGMCSNEDDLCGWKLGPGLGWCAKCAAWGNPAPASNGEPCAPKLNKPKY